MADLCITRPSDMSVALYQSLRAEFKKADDRYRKSVSENARPETQNRNKEKRDAERNALHDHLEAWKTNGSLRSLILTGNTSSAQAVELLKTASDQSVRNHAELMTILEQIRDRLPGGSSSSSADVPTHVDEVPAVEVVDPDVVNLEVPTDECIICMDSEAVDYVIMPCCIQGNKHACKTCFLELLDRHPALKCPCCRSKLDVNLPDFWTLARNLPLPRLVVEAIIAEAGQAFIPLVNIHPYLKSAPDADSPPPDVDDDDDDGSRSMHEVHVEIQCVNSTLYSNPLYATLYTGDPLHPSVYQIPVLKLSVAGDDIDTFVQTKCGGLWPCRDSAVEITCCNCPFPLQYMFMRFKRIRGQESGCLLRSLIEFANGGFVDELFIPFSQIDTWRTTHLKFEDMFAYNRAMPQQVIVQMQDGKFELCWLKRVISNNVGLQLALGRSANSLYEQVVYLGLLRAVIQANFVPIVDSRILVLNLQGRVLTPPCIVKPLFKYGVYHSMQLCDVTLLGCSKYMVADGPRFNLHFVHNGRHQTVGVSDISHLTFVRNSSD